MCWSKKVLSNKNTDERKTDFTFLFFSPGLQTQGPSFSESVTTEALCELHVLHI